VILLSRYPVILVQTVDHDAESHDRLKWIVADVDPSTPSIARVYDFFLGGTDNFPVDRVLAEQHLALAPLIADVVRENRQFIARAVAWVACQGVQQFIDLGCGLPTAPSTHQAARAAAGEARVAYVDNDPIVLSRLRALPPASSQGLTIVDGDLRDPTAILDSVRRAIDLTAPTCLILGSLLHFFALDAARDLVARYVAALAPGSYLVLSALNVDITATDADSLDTYRSNVAPLYNHSLADIAGFFGSRELVPPGVVDARQWDPPREPEPLPPRDGNMIVGVARVSQARS
jgi:O-methyltransferase involved in polyketide biosynthesis